MPDPRDSIITNLNQQMEAFFGAGNVGVVSCEFMYVFLGAYIPD